MWLMIKAYSKMILGGLFSVLLAMLFFYKRKAEKQEVELIKRNAANIKHQKDAIVKANEALRKAQVKSKKEMQDAINDPDDDRTYFE